MKKICLILLFLFLSSCSLKEEKGENNNISEENIATENTVIEEDKYTDDNPIKLGLFLYDNNYYNKSKLKDTYYTDFVNGQDIGSFEVFLTDEEMVNGTNFKNTWNKYYDNYDDIDNYKVGFNIKFILNDGTSYGSNFLEPDNYKFGDYFYVYLYDDVNQADGAFYSHLESMNDNTLLTSIKIYAVDGIDKVENFILSVFTYDSEDDFDEEGNYRGNSIYAIRIKRNG